MEVILELPADLKAWAQKQPDPNTAILEVLKKHIKETDTPVRRVTEMLVARVPGIPEGMEFEIPQIVGQPVWETLNRSERLNLGKEIKRKPETYGLEFVRKSTSNHAIYRRQT